MAPPARSFATGGNANVPSSAVVAFSWKYGHPRWTSTAAPATGSPSGWTSRLLSGTPSARVSAQSVGGAGFGSRIGDIAADVPSRAHTRTIAYSLSPESATTTPFLSADARANSNDAWMQPPADSPTATTTAPTAGVPS